MFLEKRMLGIDYRQYAVMNENCHFRVHGIMNPCIQSSSIPTVCLNFLGETIPMCFQFLVLTEIRKSYQFTDSNLEMNLFTDFK